MKLPLLLTFLLERRFDGAMVQTPLVEILQHPPVIIDGKTSVDAGDSDEQKPPQL